MDDTTLGLEAEAYLFEPPETVWDHVLLLDHASWFEHKDMDVLNKAAERTQAVSREIPREAWMALYASGNPLKSAPPQGMAVLHSLFRRAEELPEWSRLRLAVGMDPIAAAFGAAHFATELIDKLPPEVKEAMETAQRAKDRAQQLDDRLHSCAVPGRQSRGGGPYITRCCCFAASHEQRATAGADPSDRIRTRPKRGAHAAASEQAALQALDGAQARTAQSLATAMNQSADVSRTCRRRRPSLASAGASVGPVVSPGSKSPGSSSWRSTCASPHRSSRSSNRLAGLSRSSRVSGARALAAAGPSPTTRSRTSTWRRSPPTSWSR